MRTESDMRQPAGPSLSVARHCMISVVPALLFARARSSTAFARSSGLALVMFFPAIFTASSAGSATTGVVPAQLSAARIAVASRVFVQNTRVIDQLLVCSSVLRTCPALPGLAASREILCPIRAVVPDADDAVVADHIAMVLGRAVPLPDRLLTVFGAHEAILGY